MARKKTNEEFVREVYELVEDEYEFLEPYVNSQTKIKCRHNKCGTEWVIRPNNFLAGYRCPICGVETSSRKRRKTNKEFIKQVYDLVGDDYKFLEPYKNKRTKLKCVHIKCGYQWEVEANSFLNGTRCPPCNRTPNYYRDTNQFKKEVYNIVGDEYSVLGEYINADTKIKMKHDECNLEWDVRPQNFLNGTRCPQCTKSKGERAVRNFLEYKKLIFEQEYIFDDLLSDKGNHLRFDFAVFNDNYLAFLMEYDGEFHYLPIVSEEQLKTQQYNDNIKNQYCKDNNIPLLRIPYWDFDNIEQILEEWLVKHGVIHKNEKTA